MTQPKSRSFKRRSRPRVQLNLPLISLLWPDGTPAHLSGNAPWENDLGLNDVIKALSLDVRYVPQVRKTLVALVTEPGIIQWRQAVLADFVANPTLVAGVEALLPRLASFGQRNALFGRRQRNLLLDTADHLAELEAYVEVVDTLHAALSDATLASKALLSLRENLATLTSDDGFQELKAELPELRVPLERVASLTIGVNLDLELRPISAVLLEINDFKMKAAHSWVQRVIGFSSDENEDTGIAALHTTPDNIHQRVLAPLFQDLDQLLTKTAEPISRALNHYTRSGSGSVWHLEHELAFFAAGARLIQRFQAYGIAYCQPQAVPMDERVIEIEALTNVALATDEGQKPIPSTITFGEQGRIAVLTGPNSGGKTTFIRSVGLAQILFQAGLFIPAVRARISPVDKILTHFPALESRHQGRLAEEAERLREIFQQATPRSLVLLNETFSSTASGEAVYLAQDILGGLRSVGVRAIYATHLIELAERLDEIEAAAAGNSRLFR